MIVFVLFTLTRMTPNYNSLSRSFSSTALNEFKPLARLILYFLCRFETTIYQIDARESLFVLACEGLSVQWITLPKTLILDCATNDWSHNKLFYASCSECQ